MTFSIFNIEIFGIDNKDLQLENIKLISLIFIVLKDGKFDM